LVKFAGRFRLVESTFQAIGEFIEQGLLCGGEMLIE
jgi:hypothetical protein